MKYHRNPGARKSPLTPLCQGGTHEGRERLLEFLERLRELRGYKSVFMKRGNTDEQGAGEHSLN